MIFNQNGLPKDTGATDYMDSARLIGLMVSVDPTNPIKNKLGKYLLGTDRSDKLEVVRCPDESPANNPKNFTRDQLMCYAAGLYFGDFELIAKYLYENAKNRGYRAQNTEADVPGSVKKFPNGADILSPSNMNHLLLCSGQSGFNTGYAWLMMDITYHSLFTPMREPNQLICMCLVAGPKYVKLFKKLNSKWRDGIRDYWSGWRKEPEFAEEIIKRLEAI